MPNAFLPQAERRYRDKGSTKIDFEIEKIKSMEERTAILFSGSSYNIRFSLDSLMKNLVIPNNADVFIVTTRLCKRRKTPESSPIPDCDADWEGYSAKNAGTVLDMTPLQDSEIQLIKDTLGDRLKGIYIAEEMPDYVDYISKERNKMKDVANAYIRESNAKGIVAPWRGKEVDSADTGAVRFVVDQYRHVRRAYQFMEQYEQDNGFKYTYVMRARIDFICPFELNINHYVLNHDEPYLYCLGSFRRDPMEWADEFCWFSKRLAATKLYPALDRMGLINDRKYNTILPEQNNDFMFDPETQFSLLLHELNMPVVNVKIYRSSQYSPGGDGFDYFNYKFRRDPINIDYEYKLVCDCRTDINEHLPVLRKYAEECEHITELGTRYGNSTVAFLMAIKDRPAKLVAYDPQWNDKMDYLKMIAAENNLDFEMKLSTAMNDGETESLIDFTDLLFIDTNHHCVQMELELRLHSPKARKYIVLHDVVSFWSRGQGYDNGGGGMQLAIEPFLADPNCKFFMKERLVNNNGLMILERKKEAMIVKTKDQLIELVKHQQVPLIGAEIGVCGGGGSVEFLSAGMEKLYSIDSWCHLEQTGDGGQPQEWHDKNYEEAKGHLSKFGDRSVILRGKSEDVCDQIADDSLGFIYIDGDHSYAGVVKDIKNYFPKLVKNGVMAFHDYNNAGYGVTEAVTEFCKERGYEIFVTDETGTNGAYFIKL